MGESTDERSPEPTFWVYAASGKSVGYGSLSLAGVYEIYLPGGEDEGWLGTVDNEVVEFSNGELAGRVEGARVIYDDGTLAGLVRGEQILDTEGKLIGTTVGDASISARGGAVLLLVLNRWFNADGSENFSVR